MKHFFKIEQPQNTKDGWLRYQIRTQDPKDTYLYAAIYMLRNSYDRTYALVLTEILRLTNSCSTTKH